MNWFDGIVMTWMVRALVPVLLNEFPASSLLFLPELAVVSIARKPIR